MYGHDHRPPSPSPAREGAGCQGDCTWRTDDTPTPDS